jgi:diguanylate cyclase
VKILTSLRENDLGVHLSIDDFGTGYSSLSYLAKLPVDELKIDQSFIQPLDDTETGLPIVRAVIVMAHSLRLSVVTEGVETNSQLAQLRKLRCDIIQGFLFSKPVTAQALSEVLAKWRARLAAQRRDGGNGAPSNASVTSG